MNLIVFSYIKVPQIKSKIGQGYRYCYHMLSCPVRYLVIHKTGQLSSPLQSSVHWLNNGTATCCVLSCPMYRTQPYGISFHQCQPVVSWKMKLNHMMQILPFPLRSFPNLGHIIYLVKILVWIGSWLACLQDMIEGQDSLNH